MNLWLLTGFSLPILSTCPNHLSLIWHITCTILATPSLFLTCADNFLSLRLTLHIQRTISISVREILLISLSYSGQTSLPYGITLLTQAVYNFHFILYENTPEVSLIFFQPDLTWYIVLASATPPTLSTPLQLMCYKYWIHSVFTTHETNLTCIFIYHLSHFLFYNSFKDLRVCFGGFRSLLFPCSVTSPLFLKKFTVTLVFQSAGTFFPVIIWLKIFAICSMSESSDANNILDTTSDPGYFTFLHLI